MGDAETNWGTNGGTNGPFPGMKDGLTWVSPGQAGGAGGARTHDPRIMSPLL